MVFTPDARKSALIPDPVFYDMVTNVASYEGISHPFPETLAFLKARVGEVAQIIDGNGLHSGGVAIGLAFELMLVPNQNMRQFARLSFKNCKGKDIEFPPEKTSLTAAAEMALIVNDNETVGVKSAPRFIGEVCTGAALIGFSREIAPLLTFFEPEQEDGWSIFGDEVEPEPRYPLFVIEGRDLPDSAINLLARVITAQDDKDEQAYWNSMRAAERNLANRLSIEGKVSELEAGLRRRR